MSADGLQGLAIRSAQVSPMPIRMPVVNGTLGRGPPVPVCAGAGSGTLSGQAWCGMPLAGSMRLREVFDHHAHGPRDRASASRSRRRPAYRRSHAGSGRALVACTRAHMSAQVIGHPPCIPDRRQPIRAAARRSGAPGFSPSENSTSLQPSRSPCPHHVHRTWSGVMIRRFWPGRGAGRRRSSRRYRGTCW